MYKEMKTGELEKLLSVAPQDSQEFKLLLNRYESKMFALFEVMGQNVSNQYRKACYNTLLSMKQFYRELTNREYQFEDVEK